MTRKLNIDNGLQGQKKERQLVTGVCCQWRCSASYDSKVVIEAFVLRGKFSGKIATEQQPPNRYPHTKDMKTLASLITVLLFSSSSYSQVNYPIPQDSTSEWRIWRSTWDPLTSIVQSWDFRVFVSGDTTINGKVYSRLLDSGLGTYQYQGHTSTWTFENEFYAFIRTDSARTYLFFNGQDELHYDIWLNKQKKISP